MRLLAFLLALLSLTSCGLDREVNITLPDYASEPVVECYLQPGQPYRLLLSRSFGYFDAFDFGNPQAALIQGATIVIRHRGQDIVLENNLFFDPFTGKFANYGSSSLVPQDLDEPFFLDIVLPDGVTLASRTQLLPVVPIDSLVVEFTRDTLARVLTYFTEDPGKANYYRRMLHFGSLDSVLQDFVLDDGFFQTDKGAFGTGFNFKKGDTLIHTLVHLDRDYYQFLNTLNQSIVANLNPFGQPGLLVSNIESARPAIGIFTGLSLYRDTIIIP